MLAKLATPHAKAAVLVSSANLFRTACIFIGWIVLARSLGPAKLGAFAVAYGVMTLVSQLSDSGLGVGVVKFLSTAGPNSSKIQDIVRISFLIRLLISVLAASILFASSNMLAAFFFHDPSLHMLLKLGALGAIVTSYFTFVLSVYQGLQRFVAYSLWSFLYGVIWLLGLTTLWQMGQIHPATVMAITIGAFIVPAVMGHIGLGRLMLGLPDKWSVFKEMASFSKWTAAGGLLVLITMQVDVFLLNHLATAQDAGFYSAGQRLAMSISILSNSVLTVLLPRMLSNSDSQNLRTYFFRALRLLPALPVVIGIVALLAGPVVALSFGPGFDVAAPVFVILFSSFLLSILTNTFNYVGFGLDRPEIVTLSLGVQLGSLLLLGSSLATSMGAVGMALAVMISRILSLGMTMMPIWRILQRSHDLQRSHEVPVS